MTTADTFTHAGCSIEIWHDDHWYDNPVDGQPLLT